MSGLSASMPPRSRPAPERPPVDSWVMIPRQRRLIPSSTLAKRSGAELGVPSSLRTCRCTSVAPASKAACVDSICSDAAIGTAGLSFLPGTEPVIATVMMQGCVTAMGQSRCVLYKNSTKTGTDHGFSGDLGDFDQVEVRIPHIDGAQLRDGTGLHDRTLDDLHPRVLQLPDNLLQGHGGDEAQVQAAGHRHVRLGIEFPAPLVQVDLLAAELEREALLGRRAEFLQPHAEDLGIEADAGVLVAGGEDDVVDVIDHTI